MEDSVKIEIKDGAVTLTDETTGKTYPGTLIARFDIPLRHKNAAEDDQQSNTVDVQVGGNSASVEDI